VITKLVKVGNSQNW